MIRNGQVFRRLVPLLAGISAMLLLAVLACTPAVTPSPAPPTAAAPDGSAAGAILVEAGKDLFLDRCAKCHGRQGQGIVGPAIIGSNAALARFGTAQVLFDVMSKAMPRDNPGSLTSQEYLQLTGFILTQNGYIAPDEFSPDGLPHISLAR